MKIENYTITFVLLFLAICCVFLRFYNLYWGAPFYFHPDERNIASSVSQLYFPDQMNPHFFAYGSLPLYVIYFTGVFWGSMSLLVQDPSLIFSLLQHLPSTFTVPFETAIIISRAYAAVFSSLIVLLLYKTLIKIADTQTAIIGVIMATFSTGFIQFAHFGTVEMWLSFFLLLLFYLVITYIKTPRISTFFFASLVTGILLAIKISSLVFFIFPIIGVFLASNKSLYKKSIDTSMYALLLLFVVSLVFILTSPYIFLDFHAFQSSIQYESSVSLGTLPVFYTQEFIRSIPILFQFISIYPFLLNPFFTLAFIPSFFYFIYLSIKTKNIAFIYLLTFFLIVFLSQAFLYTKWTRYVVPTLPFMYIILAIAVQRFFISITHKTYLKQSILVGIIFLISSFFGIAYVMTAFVQPDTRVQASLWAKDTLPGNAPIMSEVFDLGITPFNPYFSHITLFNFYDLETDPQKPQELTQLLENSEYIVIPSQRIIKTRTLSPHLYPKGHNFYTKTLLEKYQKIYQTPCDIFCTITYMQNPIFSFEQTASVFDRPTVFIFKKNQEL